MGNPIRNPIRRNPIRNPIRRNPIRKIYRTGNVVAADDGESDRSYRREIPLRDERDSEKITGVDEIQKLADKTYINYNGTAKYVLRSTAARDHLKRIVSEE